MTHKEEEKHPVVPICTICVIVFAGFNGEDLLYAPHGDLGIGGGVGSLGLDNHHHHHHHLGGGHHVTLGDLAEELEEEKMIRENHIIYGQIPLHDGAPL